VVGVLDMLRDSPYHLCNKNPLTYCNRAEWQVEADLFGPQSQLSEESSARLNLSAKAGVSDRAFGLKKIFLFVITATLPSNNQARKLEPSKYIRKAYRLVRSFCFVLL